MEMWVNDYHNFLARCSRKKKINDVMQRDYILASIPASRRTIFVDLIQESSVYRYSAKKFFLKFPEIVFAFKFNRAFLPDVGWVYKNQYTQIFYRQWQQDEDSGRWVSKLYGCILPNQGNHHQVCLGQETRFEKNKATIIKQTIELFFNTKFNCHCSMINGMMSNYSSTHCHITDCSMSPTAFFEKWAEGSKCPKFNILDCSFLTSIPLDEITHSESGHSFAINRVLDNTDSIIELNEI